MTPNVSVVLTVYNTEDYLVQCLDSLLIQTLRNIEIICIDDASQDNSVAIIRKYQETDNRIKLIELAQNKGANFARNKALGKACGKYVIILDADDFYEPDFLEKLYNQAQATKSDITFCGFNLFDNSTNSIRKIAWDIERKILPKEKTFTMSPKLFDLLPSFVWNQLYRRQFIKENNLRFANISCYTDVYFNKTTLLKAKRIAYVDKKLVYYRVNNSHSISHNLSYSGAIRTIYALAEFLKKENLYEKYQQAFFETSLLKMNRSMNLAEPYRGFLRSFYQNHLINKFWPEAVIPETYPLLKTFDNCSPNFKKIFFHNRKAIIPVVTACDNKNLPAVNVVIQSVIDNSKPDYFYDIYILADNLSKEKCFNLYLLSRENVRISVIDMTDKNNRDMGFRRYWFYVPKLIDGYDKVLYLDYKSLVTGNLADIFKINLGNNLVAGIKNVLSPKEVKRFQKDFKTKPETYIDSSVLLFNLPLCKNNNLTEILLNNNKLLRTKKATDTHILNITCNNRIAEIISPLGVRVSPNDNYAEAKESIKHSAVISYALLPQEKSDNIFSQIWWQTARSSAQYEILIRDIC